MEGSLPSVTDQPDVGPRQYADYPEHASRFTGEPAYFKHITAAAEQLMSDMGAKPEDYTYAVFHQPNLKFPQRGAKVLGVKREESKAGLLCNDIGNPYAGASLIGLTAVLDQAKPGDRVIEVSFGSGAGSDAFSLRITDKIAERQARAPKTREYIARRVPIDYATYTRFRKKLMMT